MNEFFKQHRGKLWIAQAVAFVLLGVFVASWFGGGSDEPKVSSNSGTSNSDAMQSKPSIWTCSMHPQIRRDGPGSCPICGMDLVPVRESADGVRTVSISSEIKSLMNVQVSPVRRQYVTADVRMVGKIEYDETRLAHITAWVTKTVEGRERFPVRVRYARELRDDLESLERILVPTPMGSQIPLGQLADIRYTRGPQVIKSEDTFLLGYVLFDKKPGEAEVDVVEDAQAFLQAKIDSGEFTLATPAVLRVVHPTAMIAIVNSRSTNDLAGVRVACIGRRITKYLLVLSQFRNHGVDVALPNQPGETTVTFPRVRLITVDRPGRCQAVRQCVHDVQHAGEVARSKAIPIANRQVHSLAGACSIAIANYLFDS